MPLTRIRFEPTDNVRLVEGFRDLNLKYAEPLPANAGKSTIGFILTICFFCSATVFCTRLYGSFVPIILMFNAVFLFEYQRIDGRNFFWTKSGSDGDRLIGSFNAIKLLVVFSLISLAIPAVHHLFFVRLPFLLDLSLVLLALSIALNLYLQESENVWVIATALIGDSFGLICSHTLFDHPSSNNFCFVCVLRKLPHIYLN